MVKTADLSEAQAWAAAAATPDPEIPSLTVADLGILRSVTVEGRRATARVSPTYTGCPAVLAIEFDIARRLREAGFEPVIERAVAPAWTTDWITPEGREKLRAAGIAPPTAAAGKAALLGAPTPDCPRCGSAETARLSEFGSTACKSLWRCETCREPFDHFKCH